MKMLLSVTAILMKLQQSTGRCHDAATVIVRASKRRADDGKAFPVTRRAYNRPVGRIVANPQVLPSQLSDGIRASVGLDDA